MFHWENGNAYTEKASDNILSIRTGKEKEDKMMGRMVKDSNILKKQQSMRIQNDGMADMCLLDSI